MSGVGARRVVVAQQRLRPSTVVVKINVGPTVDDPSLVLTVPKIPNLGQFKARAPSGGPLRTVVK